MDVDVHIMGYTVHLNQLTNGALCCCQVPFCGFDQSPQPMNAFPRFSSDSQDVGSPILPNFKMCSLDNDDEDDSNSQDSGVGFDKVC